MTKELLFNVVVDAVVGDGKDVYPVFRHPNADAFIGEDFQVALADSKIREAMSLLHMSLGYAPEGLEVHDDRVVHPETGAEGWVETPDGQRVELNAEDKFLFTKPVELHAAVASEYNRVHLADHNISIVNYNKKGENAFIVRTKLESEKSHEELVSTWSVNNLIPLTNGCQWESSVAPLLVSMGLRSREAALEASRLATELVEAGVLTDLHQQAVVEAVEDLTDGEGISK